MVIDDKEQTLTQFQGTEFDTLPRDSVLYSSQEMILQIIQ